MNGSATGNGKWEMGNGSGAESAVVDGVVDLVEWAREQVASKKYGLRELARLIGERSYTALRRVLQDEEGVSQEAEERIREALWRVYRKDSEDPDAKMCREAHDLILARPADMGADLEPLAYWQWRHEKDGLTYKEIGEAVGYDATVVSRVFGGTYKGSMEDVIEACSEAKARVLGSTGGALIHTAVRAVIEDVLTDSVGSEYMSVIYGNAGIGKTWTLKEYERRGQGSAGGHPCVLITTDPALNSQTVLGEIAKKLGLASTGHPSVITRSLIDYLKRNPRVLIFDEVNNLASKPERAARLMNMVRTINDEARCGVVFCGTTNMTTLLHDKKNEALMEMILSRVELEVELPEVREVEARALLSAHFGPVSTDAWQAFLGGFAGNDMTFRRVAVFVKSARRVISRLGMKAGSPLCARVVRAAWMRIKRNRS